MNSALHRRPFWEGRGMRPQPHQVDLPSPPKNNKNCTKLNNSSLD